MTTVHRRPASPFASQPNFNPFDSDDQRSPAYTNPFDDEADSLSIIPSRLVHASRPDDLSHIPAVQKCSASRKPSNVASLIDTRNPFDDGDFTPNKEAKGRKACNLIMPEDRYSSTSDSAGSNRHKKKQTENKLAIFDDDNDGENKLVIDEEHVSGKSAKSTLRNRATSLGDSAIKEAQKLKDSGANQAQKLKEGGINQAQRVRETTYSTFKSKDGNLEQRLAKPRHDHELVQHEARDQLLTNDADSRFHTSYSYAISRRRYNDTFLQTADLESRSVQELETYAVQKSEETTSRIHNCLKVAEDIKGDAARTMITLHQQGEQIKRTHEVAVEIDHDLTTGEKLLGSLGGIFSRTWKPRKSRMITGPMLIQNDPSFRRTQHLDQRVALGLDASNPRNTTLKYPASSGQSQQLTTHSKLKIEKAHQDDALSDLSNVLGQLKEMSMDMGREISRQNGSLDHLQDDVIELGERVKGANMRGRRLLGK